MSQTVAVPLDDDARDHDVVGVAARLLRKARAQRGLTQRDLAKAAGLAQTTVGRIESGRQQPSLATLERLLDAAGFRPKVELVNSTPPSQLLARHRNEILALAQQHRITRVRVFGSVARGEDGPDSDLDLLLDFEPEASLFDQAGFTNAVEELLGVHVDTVDVGGLKPPRDRLIRRDAMDL